jgi:hypothetical protein
MKFEESNIFKKLTPFKLIMPFGNYYLCPNFFIGELHEGVHLDWSKVELLIPEILKFYSPNAKIVYIANRINSYSIDPQNWVRLEKDYDLLVASAIIIYNKPSYINASLEKQFAKQSIKRCLSLNEAVGWVENLKEFN